MDSVQEDTTAQLLALKEQALEATRRQDADFYRHYLSDDAIAVVPFGIFDKEAIVRQMSRKNSLFRSAKIDDTRVFVQSEDSGYVTYRATFEGSRGEPTSSVFVTTLYARINGEWKGIFYQQTPLQPLSMQH
ncbi:MAG TPA: nuclear transport factor 2 family protein [Phototrophicaceae bacterium]|jgi:ketosteroid isomerase-like protein|nr:nuclear transport factor 2 family protein [Phototrophicaceae bacterium]